MQSLWVFRLIPPIFSGLLVLSGVALNWWGRIVDLITFQEDLDNITKVVQGIEPDWGLWIFLLGIVGLAISIPIAIRGRESQKTVEIDTLAPQNKNAVPTEEPQPHHAPASSLDRQPIYHAYKHLKKINLCNETGHEFDEIASILRQAAIDGEIIIWGAARTLQFKHENPIFKKISSEYWEGHGIEPSFLYANPNEFPNQGFGHVKTYQEQMPEGVGTIYYYLQVDMDEVKARWPSELSLREAALAAYDELLQVPRLAHDLQEYQESKRSKLAAHMLLGHAHPPIPLYGRFPHSQKREEIQYNRIDALVINDDATEICYRANEDQRYVDLTMERSALAKRIKLLKGEDLS